MENQIMAATYNKENMTRLYNLQVEGTKGLYLDIGYFMRMRFWDTLNREDVLGKIISAYSRLQCLEVYTFVVGLMNRYIENGEQRTENINNMIFNRNMIERSYADYPELFVDNLRECFQREQVILQTHFLQTNNEVILQTNNEGIFQTNNEGILPTNTAVSQDHIVNFLLEEETEMNPPSVSLDHDMESPSLLSNDQSFQTAICFEDAFIEQLQAVFNDFETNLRYKSNIEREYNVKKQGISVQNSAELDDLEKQRGIADQKVIHHRHLLLCALENSVNNLSDTKDKYLRYQALMEVKLFRKEMLEPRLSIVFGRFAGFLNKLFHDYKVRDSRLEAIITSFMDLCVVVKEHPPDFVFVDNEKKGEKSKGESSAAGKGKAAPKTYCTKKKESILTSLMILGFHNLSNGFIRDKSIRLETEEGAECGQLSYPNCEMNKEVGELSFTEIKINGYERRGSSNINNQFVRLSFDLKLSCFDHDFDIRTKSLPFFLCTGAVQELELIGSRMWYIGSNDNMYTDCVLHDDLEPKKVIDILDQRIQSIGSQGGRRLSDTGKEFLQNLIPGQHAAMKGQKPKNISLHSLVKNKGKKDDKKPSEKNFSFFTWFYALVHTLETYLHVPWNDGVIYDLMTKEQAEQVLLNDHVKCSTALIRPARSFVLKPNCKDAQVKVAVEIRRHIGGDDKIEVVNLDMSYIKENSLFGALESITDGNDDSSVIKYILTKDGHCLPLKELKKYNDAETKFDEYHNSVVKQVANLRLQGPSKSSSIPAAKMTKYNQDDHSPRKRKSSRQTSLNGSPSSSTQMPSNSPWNLDDSLSMSDLNPAIHRNDLKSPGASSSSQSLSPRNLERLNSLEMQDVKQEIVDTSSQSPKQTEWTSFGGVVKVDVSCIAMNQQVIMAAQVPPTATETTMSTEERVWMTPLTPPTPPTPHLSWPDQHTDLMPANGIMIDHTSQQHHVPQQFDSIGYSQGGLNRIATEEPIPSAIMDFMQDSSLPHFPHSLQLSYVNSDVNSIAEMLRNSADSVQRSNPIHMQCAIEIERCS